MKLIAKTGQSVGQCVSCFVWVFVWFRLCWALRTGIGVAHYLQLRCCGCSSMFCRLVRYGVMSQGPGHLGHYSLITLGFVFLAGGFPWIVAIHLASVVADD